MTDEEIKAFIVVELDRRERERALEARLGAFPTAVSGKRRVIDTSRFVARAPDET